MFGFVKKTDHYKYKTNKRIKNTTAKELSQNAQTCDGNNIGHLQR